jgi:hypothetical protein
MYIQMPSTVVGSRQAKRGGGEALVLYMMYIYVGGTIILLYMMVLASYEIFYMYIYMHCTLCNSVK